MNERQFKILLLWTTPIAFFMAIVMKYDILIEKGMLIPLIISLPIGMFFSYLIYIKGIEDDGFYNLYKKNHVDSNPNVKSNEVK